jgi:multiple sugar transport system permease protein
MTAIPVETAATAADARKAGRWLFAATVILLCAWVLVPIYLLIVNTLSAPTEVSSFPKRIFPSFDFGSLSFFINFAGVGQALVNSVLVAGLTMVLSIGLGAPAGYALSRFDFPGKEAFRLLVLMTRAFPLPLLALPLAVMFIRTGLDDTVLGLALVHTTLALPFAVLITFSLFSGIPLELEEAAWTLGCTRLQAFRKVIMPLALPGHRRSLPSRSHGTRYSRPRCSPSRTGR